MPEYKVWNGNVAETIRCETAGKAVDLFIALHPEQRDNALRVTLTTMLTMSIKCDEVLCNLDGLARCLKCGYVSCPWHFAGLGIECSVCGGDMTGLSTPSSWHAADIPKSLREQGSHE